MTADHDRRPGWFGPKGQMMHVLRTLGADTDDKGHFLVRGTIASFMGDPSDNADVVIGGDAEYRRGGVWSSLPSAMNATSYGVRGITVI